MHSRTIPIVVGSLVAGAILVAVGFAFAPDDAESRDPSNVPGGPAAGACLEGTPDCLDQPGPGTGAAPGQGQGIAVGEPNPSAPGGFKDPFTRDVPAPIDDVEIVVDGSQPSRYAVRVVSGLPNGCTDFDAISVTRVANTVEITVTNVVRNGDGSQACALVYGQVEHIVDLGDGFVAGESYAIAVNAHKFTFVAG